MKLIRNKNNTLIIKENNDHRQQFIKCRDKARQKETHKIHH